MVHNGLPFHLKLQSYIVEFLDENEWYYKFFENTLCPDEWFFHTLIMNSPYRTEVVNNNLMFLKWGETLSDTKFTSEFNEVKI